MSGRKDDAQKNRKVSRPDAERDIGPAAREPLRGTAGKLLGSLDPQAPMDRSVRRTIEETLERAARSEERLASAERRIEWLESRNVSDEVTGLLNRRGLGDALERAIARARRYGETGSLLLLDLPCYETIAEERGASASDYVLAAVGNILQRQFREVDYIARLEGGRFAVLLLQISDEDSRRRAVMLKDHLGAVTVPWDGEDIAIHVRIGIVPYVQNDTADDILERAEAELEEREQRIARLRKPAQ
jgi:diguanylate cyclase (GGDEF)-like protein